MGARDPAPQDLSNAGVDGCPHGCPRGAPAKCDLSPASSIRMLDNKHHYYRKFDFAGSAVNGAPSMRGCPGGNITSIGDLQVRYFQPGGVPVESFNSFYLLCNNLCDSSLLGGLTR